MTRPYWTGTTEQSMPRAAPGVFPMPYHQSLYAIDGTEAKRAGGKLGAAIANAKRRLQSDAI